MAQGKDNGNGSALVNISAEDWAKACIAAGYTVRDGKPVLGISGDVGDGFLVTLDPPTAISPVNLARALCSYALRVGQGAVKGKKEPTRQDAIDGANSALANYAPSRERDNDVLTREAERHFERHVTALVRNAKPDATPDDINATVKAQSETESGKKWIADKIAEIYAAGTYTVSRKGATGKGAAVAVTL